MAGGIYVIGAGPWDPDLLTVRAVKVLGEADVVAFGRLVNPTIVEMYAPRAKKVFLGHRREEHDNVVSLLIDEAAKGAMVAVLKNGDPTLFGRGHHICRRARDRGVRCEIVPGVPSVTAASALYGIALTDVDGPNSLCMVSYPNYEKVYDLAGAATLVIFMIGSRARDVAEKILDLFGDIEVHVCYRVSYPDGGCQVVQASQLPLMDVPQPYLVIVRRR